MSTRDEWYRYNFSARLAAFGIGVLALPVCIPFDELGRRDLCGLAWAITWSFGVVVWIRFSLAKSVLFWVSMAALYMSEMATIVFLPSSMTENSFPLPVLLVAITNISILNVLMRRLAAKLLPGFDPDEFRS